MKKVLLTMFLVFIISGLNARTSISGSVSVDFDNYEYEISDEQVDKEIDFIDSLQLISNKNLSRSKNLKVVEVRNNEQVITFLSI